MITSITVKAYLKKYFKPPISFSANYLPAAYHQVSFWSCHLQKYTLTQFLLCQKAIQNNITILLFSLALAVVGCQGALRLLFYSLMLAQNLNTALNHWSPEFITQTNLFLLFLHYYFYFFLGNTGSASIFWNVRNFKYAFSYFLGKTH